MRASVRRKCDPASCQTPRLLSCIEGVDNRPVGRPRLWWVLAAWAVGSSQTQAPVAVDHHQHLFSQAVAGLSPGLEPVTAADLISLLDAAGIRQAVVFSQAYQFGNPNRPPVANEYEHIKAENDGNSQQVARFPNRLRAFCAVNPMKDYALDELARCSKDPRESHQIRPDSCRPGARRRGRVRLTHA
jgi:hypothetical protein